MKIAVEPKWEPAELLTLAAVLLGLGVALATAYWIADHLSVLYALAVGVTL